MDITENNKVLIIQGAELKSVHKNSVRTATKQDVKTFKKVCLLALEIIKVMVKK